MPAGSGLNILHERLLGDESGPWESEISSAKYLLATKIKECAVSEADLPKGLMPKGLKGGGTRPSDIISSTAKGYYKISVGPKCYQATASYLDHSSSVVLSDFSLSHDDDGKTWRTCLAGEYPYGCFADKDLTVEQEPGMPGYW